MNLSHIRRIFLWSFIGFLSLSAIIAIFSVLSHEFGDTQIKVLATTFTISAASICAMSCAAFMEKRRMNLAGITGILFAAAAAVTTVACIWDEFSGEKSWKIVITLIVVSVAFTHTLLLWIPNLASSHRWTQVVSAVVIAILVVQIIYAIWAEIDTEPFYRVLAVISIVVVLMTLIVPICSKLGGKQDRQFDCLVLHKVSESIYTDQSGRQLRVTEIDTEKNA